MAVHCFVCTKGLLQATSRGLSAQIWLSCRKHYLPAKRHFSDPDGRRLLFITSSIHFY